MFLIQMLHCNTSFRVRLGTNGLLSESIPTERGVCQGCLLAPFLFSFYINNIVQELSSLEFFPPTIRNAKLSVLLYADDIAMVSTTLVGMRRLLANFSKFCAREHLTINYTKTKVVVFGKKRKFHTQKLDGKPIEQLCNFRYLGLCFNAQLSWKYHLKAINLKASKSSQSLLQFTSTHGRRLVAPEVDTPNNIWGRDIKTLT